MALAFFVYNFIVAFSVLLTSHLRKGSGSYFWNPLTITTLLVASLLIGLRQDVGVDFISYQTAYINTWHSGDYLFDILFQAGNLVKAPYSVGFLLVAFVQFWFCYKAFEDKPELLAWGIFFLYIGQTVFFLINGLRQGIAICVLLYAGRYLVNRKYIGFLLWVIVAGLFHRSAFLCVFLPLFASQRVLLLDRTLLQLTLLCLTFVFKAEIYGIPIEAYKALIAVIGQVKEIPTLALFVVPLNSGLGVFLRYVTYALVCLLWRGVAPHNDTWRIYFRLFFFGALFQIIADRDMNLSRTTLYLSSFSVIVYAYLSSRLLMNWSKVGLLNQSLAVATLVALIMLYIASILSGENCSPYNFISF